MHLGQKAPGSAGHYAGPIGLAARHGTPLASHDDTTAQHVEDAVRDRVALAEFPATIGAAAALHAAGIKVMMGRPISLAAARTPAMLRPPN